MLKTVSIIIVAIIIFISSVFVVDHFFPRRTIGGDFTLAGSNGQTVTFDDIRAKPAVVFFGYTMCPDICPTTLFDMQQWIEILGPEAENIGFWFFSVDPERDTPEVLHDYLANFSDKIVGISGNPKDVHKAIASFKIIARKVEGDDNDYTYDHTAAIILLRPGGKIAGVIPYDPNSSADDAKTLQVIERLKRLAELGKGK